jgi:hypothetical protein
MNFIKKYYINRQLCDFVQQKTDRNFRVHTLKDARSICFFICGDDTDKVEDLIQCVSTLYKEKEIVIICYLSRQKEFKTGNMPSFLYAVSAKDVGTTGRMKGNVQKIFSKQYDIFIDLDTKINLISLYLKTLLKADFRIGGNQTYYKYFDFVFCDDEQRSVKDYLSNLELYTSKIKGI